VLRALSSPNLDIRRKTLDIALDLITARNIDEVSLALGPRCIYAYVYGW
jgi:coatomer subunit beta